jgi:hypothetical protein
VTPSPGPTETPTENPTPTAAPTPTPTTTGGGIGAIGGTGGSGGDGSTDGGGGGSGSGGSGDPPGGPDLTGSGVPDGLGLWVTAAVLGLLGFFFLLFTRRRRRPEEDAVDGGGALALAAAGPLPVVPPRPAPPTAPVLPDTPEEEALLPRWRRPSVQSARKTSSRGVELPHVAVSFKDGATDVERRRIRYRLVRVSSIPDEIMGEEVARLDRGDEVELLRSAGAYWLVRTPYGAEGWVHQMTLESGTPDPDDDAPIDDVPEDDNEAPF